MGRESTAVAAAFADGFSGNQGWLGHTVAVAGGGGFMSLLARHVHITVLPVVRVEV